jgi:hypothetical protein
MQNNLRAAVRSNARRRFAAFLAATALWCGVTRASRIFQADINAVLGERAELCIFGVGFFAVFLGPMIVVECLLSKDQRLHCPKCGKCLVRLSVFSRRKNCIHCRCCGTDLEFEKRSRSQICTDLVIVFGGLSLLTLFLLILWQIA